MLRACAAHALLDPPQGLAAHTQRNGFVLFAVGRGAGTIEHPIAGRLHKNDVVMLAQLGQTLDRTLLQRQPLFADTVGLEPVEIVGKVDQRIRARVIEQLGQARRVPAFLWRARGEKADIFLGSEANQRLPEGIPTTQQHQAHSHRVSRSGQV
ncbi:hypothetical protein D3C85_1207600 [compost metagenome]